MILQSLTLYSPDRRQALLTDAETARLLGTVPVSARYGEPVEVTTTSMQFAPDVGLLATRLALRAVYVDADAGGAAAGPIRVVRWWRCRSLTESVGDSSLEVVCVWRPLWLDAAETIARPADVTVLGDAGTLDLALRIVDRPLPDALGVVLAPGSGAPQAADGSALLTVGVTAGPLATAHASLTASGATTLQAIEALAADTEGEYRVRVVEGPTPSEDTYAVDFFVPADPDAPEVVPIVTVEITGTTSNAVRMQRTETDDGAASVVVPLAQGDAQAGETTGSLAGNRLAVADTSASGGERTIALDVAPVVWEAGALVGLEAEVLAAVNAQGDATTISVGNRATIIRSEAPATIVLDNHVDGGVVGVHPTAVRLLAPGGGPLVSLESPSLAQRYGRIERAVSLDVAPLANLLAEPGRMPEPVSADLSEWTESDVRPLGVYPTGGATFTREAETADFGEAALRVVATEGAGLRIDCGPYRASAAGVGGVGAWAGLHLVTGTVALRLVQYDPGRGREVTIIEAEGSSQPDLVAFTELAVAVTADKFPALTEAGEQPLTLEIAASGGPAEWITDALTVTAAPQAAAYRASMGPRALLEAAAAYLGTLTREGGDTWEGEWLDVASVDGSDGTYLLPGDPVRLRVLMASGLVERDVRVLELSYVDAVGRAPVEMQARFGRALPGLYDAVQGAASRVTVQTSGGSGGGSGVALDVPPLPSVAAAQPANADPGGADGVLVTVGIPTGSASGTSAHVSLVSDDGESVRESAVVSVADFTAAAARGQSVVSVRFSVDRGGAFEVRAVPVRHGVEGPASVREITVDASAPGTTASSLPPARGIRVQRTPDVLLASWDPFDDARVRGAGVTVASSDTAAALIGPESSVLARPGVQTERIELGPDSQLAYRPPEADRAKAFRFFVVPLSFLPAPAAVTDLLPIAPPDPGPPSVTLTRSPSGAVAPGQPVTLTFGVGGNGLLKVELAAGGSPFGSAQAVPAGGSGSVTLGVQSQSVTYTATATNEQGQEATASVTVAPTGAPPSAISAPDAPTALTYSAEDPPATQAPDAPTALTYSP